ncbi:hypothetical protein [Gaetbulibacter saemankumensis]|uniref:hypothetical protein n=1 Tax=Gaetbulibacter saemankumensis TaxID=311208 RepID=UPI00048A31B1|nr:hypothetical protein [Gaetbulibacter saemankumensis]
MNKLIITNMLLFIVLLLSHDLIGQQKLTKVSQSINVDKEAVVDLNTSYCNIVFETWNKDVVQIEAYIESDKLSDSDLKEALKNWTVDIDATRSDVQIATRGHAPKMWVHRLGDDTEDMHAIIEELKFAIADAPNIDYEFIEVPEVNEIIEVPRVPEMPELPELPEGLGDIYFDYEAYQKDGESYLEEYSKELEKTLGKDFQAKMADWGENYAKKMEAMEHKLEAQMKKQEEQIQKRHAQIIILNNKREEAMGERLKFHEKQRREHDKLADERRIIVEKLVTDKSNADVKKTIRIKIPKDAKLKVNVRHGELKIASAIDNLKANLSYTKLVANSINGSSTSVNASYAPVKITNWNVGELNVNYVEDVEIGQIKHIVLTANSSKVNIEKLSGNAIINGSIGDLNIAQIDDAFTNLNIILQNSNASIALPSVDYNLQYVGSQSNFKHPLRKSQDKTSSFSTGATHSGKSILVNAKFSNVTMQ